MIPPRWSLRLLQAQQVPDGYHFVATTDVPCHLFLRWTYWIPRTHKDPIVRRGVTFFEQVRFCLVSYHDNEQEEAGDTLAHTFEKQDWPLDKNRYFMFWATIGGEPSPSESPLFERTFTGVGEYVKTIGVFDSADVFLGNVKLKEGAGITLTEDDPNNAIEIASPGARPFLFGGHWQMASSSGHTPGIWDAGYDYVRQYVHAIGEDHQLFTLPQYGWGTWNDESLELKLFRTTPAGGVPHWAFGIVFQDPNILDNPTQDGIWFRGSYIYLYAENANGTTRTSTQIRDSDFGVPTWLRWTREADTIKFYYRNTLQATHTTNLPIHNKECIFTFQVRGRDVNPRVLGITRPRIYSYQP